MIGSSRRTAPTGIRRSVIDAIYYLAVIALAIVGNRREAALAIARLVLCIATADVILDKFSRFCEPTSGTRH